MIKVIIFDLGGVVLDSPFEEIEKFEERNGIKKGSINKIIRKKGWNGSFSKLERNEIKIEEFCKEFEKEIEIEIEKRISVREFIESIEKLKIREKVIEYIDLLRIRGYKTCVITNNWYGFQDENNYLELKKHFDLFIESRIEKINKPNPKIFELCIHKLKNIKYEECLFLDDIGINLKYAYQLGIKTIKVLNQDQLLMDLEKIFNLKSHF